MERVGTLIVGAGVVGAAMAHVLAQTGEEVCVLEAEAGPGRGTSSRNSGVIHAGLYYPSGSLKESACRRGAQLLYRFAQIAGVPHQRVGKYIVATDDREEAYLTWLERNVAGAVPLHRVEVPEGIRAKAALFSPNTGIIDQHGLIEALLNNSDATVLYHQRVTQIDAGEKGIEVCVDGDWFLADRVVNCAGLSAADLCAGSQHYFARGNYFALHIPQGVSLPHLVYPAVPKGSPGLGIHLTRNIAGEAYLGPDVEWIDSISYVLDPERIASFFEAARRYLPWLEKHHLSPGFAGIRPKLHYKEYSDFLLHREAEGRLVHCLGIESPGLTAALALAEWVARDWRLDLSQVAWLKE